MKVIEKLSDWKKLRGTLKQLSIGFVPTMGALHEGHASLLRKSSAENQVTVLSIYVNPTQFDDPSDLQKYPNTWEKDLMLAKECGVDYVISPDFSDLYPDNYRFRVTEDRFSKKLCGADRPGHFDGVLTVVLKLLNLVKADRAYFGEKDYQQFELVRDMASSFFIDTEIIPCPIVREGSGLALSSRNRRIPEAAQKMASRFFQTLQKPNGDSQVSNELSDLGFSVDYVETHHGRRFAAVRIGEDKEQVRLIDNVTVN